MDDLFKEASRIGDAMGSLVNVITDDEGYFELLLIYVLITLIKMENKWNLL